MLHAGRVEAALRPQSLAAAARVALCTQVGWIVVCPSRILERRRGALAGAPQVGVHELAALA